MAPLADFSILTDEALAHEVQQGSHDAFGVLVERYEQKLLRYGKKFLASSADIEEYVQDVFMNAYQNIQSFDSAQRFSPWIYRIAHNVFVNGLRKRSRSPVFVLDLDTLIPFVSYTDTIETDIDREQIQKSVAESLEVIAPQYREILILYYQEELSYKEIADVLRVPIGTVGIRLNRARAALKKKLAPEITTPL